VSDSDSRRAPRFTVENLPGRAVTSSEVEIVNMSLGGVAFRVERHLRIGEPYTLKLELGDQVVAVTGEVVWCLLTELRKEASGETTPVYSAGMRIEGVLSDAAQGLLRFLDRHKIVEENRLGGVRLHVEGRGRLDLPEDYAVRILSLSGMLVETARPLKPGDELPMEIQQPGGEPPLRFRGRVASCTEAMDRAPRHYDVGIEFADMPAGERERLAHLVESVSKVDSA
jgi:Tfp pilus assembly protein PilZ